MSPKESYVSTEKVTPISPISAKIVIVAPLFGSMRSRASRICTSKEGGDDGDGDVLTGESLVDKRIQAPSENTNWTCTLKRELTLKNKPFKRSVIGNDLGESSHKAVSLYYEKQAQWKQETSKENCHCIPAVSPGYNDRGVRLESDHGIASNASFYITPLSQCIIVMMLSEYQSLEFIVDDATGGDNCQATNIGY